MGNVQALGIAHYCAILMRILVRGTLNSSEAVIFEGLIMCSPRN